MLLKSERVSEMNFLANRRPKLEKFSFWCPLWEHLMEIFSQVNSKETETLVENSRRQNCLDKSLNTYININHTHSITCRVIHDHSQIIEKLKLKKYRKQKMLENMKI